MTSNRARKAETRTHQASTGSRYVVALRETEPPTLAEVMQQHPQLTSEGIGIGAFGHRGKTPEQRWAELAAGRERLVSSEDDVAEVAAWLRRNISPIKTPGYSSYSLKHLVEDDLGRYVSNGEAIAAALVVGYPFRHVEGPNVLLGMSRRDVKRLRTS